MSQLKRYKRMSTEVGVFGGVGEFSPKFQVEDDVSPTILRVGKLDASAFHAV